MGLWRWGHWEFGLASLVLSMVIASPAQGRGTAPCRLAAALDNQIMAFVIATDGEGSGDKDATPLCTQLAQDIPVELETFAQPGQALLWCGDTRACGKRWSVLKTAKYTLYAPAGSVQAIDIPNERALVPQKPTAETGGAHCAEMLVRAGGAEFFALDGAPDGTRAIIGLERLDRGTLVGACSRLGGLIGAWVNGRPGLIIADDLEGTCRQVAPEYFTGPEANRDDATYCLEPRWDGTGLARAWHWQVTDENGAQTRTTIIEPEARGTVDGVSLGSDGVSIWWRMTLATGQGWVRSDAVALGEMQMVIPNRPRRQCPKEVAMGRLTCAATVWVAPEVPVEASKGARRTRRTRRTPDAPEPIGVHLEAGTELPIIALGDETATVALPTGEGTLGDLGCLALNPGPRMSLRFVLGQPSGPDRCDAGRLASRLDDALDERWWAALRAETRALAVRIKRAPDAASADGLLRTAPTDFPVPKLTAGGLALLADHGASRRILRAAVGGVEAAISPFEREAQRLSAIGRAGWKPGKAPSARAGRTRAGRAHANARQPLSLSRRYLAAGFPLAARTLAVDRLVASQSSEPDVAGPLSAAQAIAALADYRHAIRASWSSNRAFGPLTVRCTERADADAQVCALAAWAALDHDRAPQALSLLPALERFSGSDARMDAAHATLLSALGTPDAPMTWLRALGSALEREPPGAPLVERIRLQCARVAVETGEMDAADALMRTLHEPTGRANAALRVTIDLALGRATTALKRMAREGFGLGTWDGDPELAVWAVSILTSICHFPAARRLTRGIRGALDTLAPLPALIARANGGRDTPLERRLTQMDGLFESLNLDASVITGLDGVFGSNGPCERWIAADGELRRIRRLPTRRGDERAPIIAHLQGLADSLRPACDQGLSRASGAVDDHLTALGTRVDELIIDGLGKEEAQDSAMQQVLERWRAIDTKGWRRESEASDRAPACAPPHSSVPGGPDALARVIAATLNCLQDGAGAQLETDAIQTLFDTVPGVALMGRDDLRTPATRPLPRPWLRTLHAIVAPRTHQGPSRCLSGRLAATADGL